MDRSRNRSKKLPPPRPASPDGDPGRARPEPDTQLPHDPEAASDGDRPVVLAKDDLREGGELPRLLDRDRTHRGEAHDDPLSGLEARRAALELERRATLARHRDDLDPDLVHVAVKRELLTRRHLHVGLEDGDLRLEI